MDRFIRITTFTQQGAGPAAAAWRLAARQPSWVTRFALLAFLLVIGLPLAILFLLALLAATLVFGALALASAAGMWLRGKLPRRDGRENVRIIRRIP
jgi:hypothetical protein